MTLRRAGVLALAAVLAAAAAGCRDRGSEQALARFGGTGEAGQRKHLPLPARPDPAFAAAAPGERLPPRPPQPPDRRRAAAAPVPAPEDVRRARFLGMSPAALADLLGPPALVRREGPARVWQYRATGCVVDLVLYPEQDGAAVRHLAARARPSAEPSDPASCLQQVLQRARRARAAPAG